jgi:hypothetical protein
MKQIISKSILGAIIFSMNYVTVFPAEVKVAWSPPDTNEDGSPLGPGDLTGFEVYYGRDSRFTPQGLEKPDFEYENTIDTGLSTSLSVENLLPETTYYFAVKAYDSGWQLSRYCENPSEISVTTDPEDTTPPVIMDVIIGEITHRTCEIWWITNELSDSQARYGETTDYDFYTERDPEMVTIHYVKLLDLKQETLYHFQVGSRDAAGNLGISDDMTFTTKQKLFNVPPPGDK